MYIATGAAQATKTEPGASGLDPKFTPWNQFETISLINSGVANSNTVGEFLYSYIKISREREREKETDRQT